MAVTTVERVELAAENEDMEATVAATVATVATVATEAGGAVVEAAVANGRDRAIGHCRSEL